MEGDLEGLDFIANGLTVGLGSDEASFGVQGLDLHTGRFVASPPDRLL